MWVLCLHVYPKDMTLVHQGLLCLMLHRHTHPVTRRHHHVDVKLIRGKHFGAVPPTAHQPQFQLMSTHVSRAASSHLSHDDACRPQHSFLHSLGLTFLLAEVHICPPGITRQYGQVHGIEEPLECHSSIPVVLGRGCLPLRIVVLPVTL